MTGKSDPIRLRPIVLLGPTAGGKSELAVLLAERLGGGQVLGADSMQVYRGMDAGTAKPSPALRARVPHLLIDCADPTQTFTVADWLTQADQLIAQGQARGVRSIVVGGTNLYIQAFLEGLFAGPPRDADLRAQLEKLDGSALYARLAAVDSQAAGKIHANDRKKLIRAIEVFELTGQPISTWQKQWTIQNPPSPGAADGQMPNVECRMPNATQTPDPASNSPFDIRHSSLTTSGGGGEKMPNVECRMPNATPVPASNSSFAIRHSSLTTSGASGGSGGGYRHGAILLGLSWPTEMINKRINLRVKGMFYPQQAMAQDGLSEDELWPGRGLVDEVKELNDKGLLGRQAREALGYKQVLAYLNGQCSLEEAYEQTKIQTRRFAKRQRTWLKRFRGVHWLQAAGKKAEELADEALAAIGGQDTTDV
ncbi:MAG: tRNA (adenosine(37)-N6)-dimethylallyltransferase MiaA [Phycisphaeraceae bacterium]|nr:tRNA (adenosine(37)-N6)-dimethylallyltransferase MiaA [Phycisphaeraceae bacterium]